MSQVDVLIGLDEVEHLRDQMLLTTYSGRFYREKTLGVSECILNLWTLWAEFHAQVLHGLLLSADLTAIYISLESCITVRGYAGIRNCLIYAVSRIFFLLRCNVPFSESFSGALSLCLLSRIKVGDVRCWRW